MQKTIKTMLNLACLLCCYCSLHAQANTPARTAASAWDGMVVAGYVNDGGFVNFGGPSIRFIKRPFAVSLGMLPTLRFKKDKVAEGAKENSTVMPTAGIGISFVYRHLVVQVPFYYNGKTATSDGAWKTGVGIGYKF
jgi:hypothetical protein